MIISIIIMWVSKNTDWHHKHNDLTKYFFEKVKQLVDYDEIISNKHRTTTGLSLIKEICDVSELTLKRKKSFKRLESLILESIDSSITSNIKNDFILTKYHNDIPEYYMQLKHRIKDDENFIKDTLLKSKIFFLRLDSEYFQNLKYEIQNFDFDNQKFYRASSHLDKIIETLIPYLLFCGYSPTTISDIAYRMVKKPFGTLSPIKFLQHFKSKPAVYDFLFITEKDSSEFASFHHYFIKKKVKFGVTNIDNVKKLFNSRGIKIQENECVYEITHECSDPHNFLRNLYEKSIRRFVLQQKRESLGYFNNYFDKIYWRYSGANHIYQPSNVKVDPINIVKRKSTLNDSLKLISEENKLNYSGELPIILEIQDSVYFYNLALGSKSIENSLMLLWSSLESLIPYRFKNTDIENVQYFVSKSLAIGSIGRTVSSFGFRLIDSSNFHKDLNYFNLGIKPEIVFTPDKFSYWAVWLGDDSKLNTERDPYIFLKSSSNLLCKQYIYLNKLFSGSDNIYKTEDIINRISSSQKSIEYQLDRIYLHRNQIVHSGKFINEYSNLWLHLEWYVGKLLSYCFLRFYNDPENFDKEKIFMELEGDYDLLMNMLKNHSNKKVKDIQFAYSKLFQHTWQFF